jgi:hypothetical protein
MREQVDPNCFWMKALSTAGLATGGRDAAWALSVTLRRHKAAGRIESRRNIRTL